MLDVMSCSSCPQRRIMVRVMKNRGFTDKLYFANFISTHIIIVAVILLTALSGKMEITDMSALSVLPTAAYAELGLHTCFIIWKAKCENMSKYGKSDSIEMN